MGYGRGSIVGIHGWLSVSSFSCAVEHHCSFRSSFLNFIRAKSVQHLQFSVMNNYRWDECKVGSAPIGNWFFYFNLFLHFLRHSSPTALDKKAPKAHYDYSEHMWMENIEQERRLFDGSLGNENRRNRRWTFADCWLATADISGRGAVKQKRVWTKSSVYPAAPTVNNWTVSRYSAVCSKVSQ